MISEPRPWWPYAERDERGFIVGVKDEAPEAVKREYEAFLERRRNGKED